MASGKAKKKETIDVFNLNGRYKKITHEAAIQQYWKPPMADDNVAVKVNGRLYKSSGYSGMKTDNTIAFWHGDNVYTIPLENDTELFLLRKKKKSV